MCPVPQGLGPIRMLLGSALRRALQAHRRTLPCSQGRPRAMALVSTFPQNTHSVCWGGCKALCLQARLVLPSP